MYYMILIYFKYIHCNALVLLCYSTVTDNVVAVKFYIYKIYKRNT